MRNEDKLQKILVDSANRRIQSVLHDYCVKTFNSEKYYSYVNTNLETKVIEIPNPQMWIEDDYITNSTTFSLLNVAKEPYTFSQQPVNYQIPVDEKNFGENMMGEVTDGVFFSRYVSECLTVFKEIEKYYPTHQIEVFDFSFALFTLWARTNEMLLRRVKDHYKRFFTHHMINPLMTGLVCKRDGYLPNIKLVMYDCAGTIAQCSQRKFEAFSNRFKSNYELISVCSYDLYEKFIEEVIAPLRSMKSINKTARYYDMEYREVETLSETAFHDMQALMLGQKRSMHKFTHIALGLLANGVHMNQVLEALKEEVDEGTYTSICKHVRDNEGVTFPVYHTFLEKNIKTMKDRGINFVKYKYSTDLNPCPKVLSEVIINMDEFRKQYPSCTEQQFTEIFLMAHSINSCKREMKCSFKKRDKWALCVKIIAGEKPFEFGELTEKLTTKLRSEQMDNFITRIV